jgi:succinyl-diaminopimelate desuccinylase
MNDATVRLYSRIDASIDTAIDWQRRLTAIPALSPGEGFEGEWKKSELVQSLLHEAGCEDIENVHAPDRRAPEGLRPNLIARIPGKNHERRIWILSHMDVVPAGERSLWNHDPFDAVVKDGRIFGRGTEDNQQGIVSSLIAVKALQETGTVPESDVGLAIVSDEETGSEYGIGHVLSVRPEWFRKQDWIVIPDAGNTDGTLIEVAEKSILWLKAVTRGKQAHGSEPDKGINAHKAAAFFVSRMNDLVQRFPARNPVFQPPGSTFEPTKKEANVPNINTIPGMDVVYFDCRILPSVSLEDVQTAIRGIADGVEREFGVRIELSDAQKIPAPDPTPADAPVVSALQAAIRDVLGRSAEPMGIGGGTVAALFRRLGLPAVVWQTIEDTAHAPNESCVITNLIQDAKVFAHLFMQSP